jgi:hypothetical protein
MPYLLMFLSAFLFGLGVWMLQTPKSQIKEPIETVVSAAPLKPEVESPKAEVSPGLSSKEKGNAFEKFVVDCFNPKVFTIKQWQGDKFHKGRYAESNSHPDLLLEFHHTDTKVQLAVECKWKSSLPDVHNWAEDRQIQNYQAFADEMKLPVFVVLGFGGTPEKPEEVYVAPLRNLKYSQVKKSYLAPFLRKEASHHFFFNPEKNQLR